ncbi:M10 family metallopeptidase C-terminal domain-containing protein, partial [Gammaproteobacteria bacterium]|nr:M10 family metallopeptidase C-terminal domain-containing protein [Gammaproteobacteria bacterium]
SNLTVDESNYGLTIGSFTTSDPNSNDSFTYSIVGGSNSNYFEINTLGELKLKDTSYADYEVDDTLTVTIRTTDQGGLYYDQTFNISVNNLAYATPDVSDIRPQSIPSSGNDIIDNLLWGFSIDYDRDPSTPLTITYSLIGTNSVFASNYSDVDDYWWDGVFYERNLDDQFTDRIVNGSAAWEALVDQAFAYWGEITGINFVKVEETSTQVGDIRIGLQSSWADQDSRTLGFSNVNKEAYGSAAYDVWLIGSLDPESPDFSYTGSSPEFVLIHEIGHSLGLAHPHDGGGGSTAIFDPGLTDAYTVMSYSGRGHLLKNWDIDGDGTYEYEYWDAISAVSPSIYDIKTAQYIYGMTPDLNGGDNNYLFSGPVFETIYDTGGHDTIDLSSYSLNTTLDLTPGTVSYIGTNEIYVSYYLAPNIYDYIHGNTGFPISIAEGTIIEDATTGSGDDEITCNVAVNSITCGLGDDTVFTISTGDSIYGGGGDDWFYISEANFTIIEGGGGNDSLLLESIGSSFDLSDFTDAQITGIENIDIQWGSANVLTLTKQDILNLNGDIAYDLDEDGDDDYVTWILGDGGQDNILLSAEGWSYDSNVSSYAFAVHGYVLGYDSYYKNDNGDTYFATSAGVGVYVKSGDGDISITDQTVAENRADAAVGILSKGGLTQLSPYGSLFTISGTDADKFEVDIDGTTLRLKTGTVFDYEIQTTYNITITVLGVSTDYQITVIDGEENDIVGQHWSVAASETITGTAADDFIDYDGGDDTIDGKSGNDILIIDHDKTTAFEIITAGGITKIKVGSSASIDYAYDDVRMINVESIKFNDRYVSLNTTLPTYDEIIWGTSSSEDLSTTSGDDLIDSAGGNDKILDNGGDDTLVIFGYTGNFEVMTVAGITKIYGDTNVSGIGSAYYGDIIKTINVESIAFSNQTITLNTTLPSGTYYIYWSYTSASETITASDEIDLIDGSGGSDYINGKGGNDTLAVFSDRANFEIITIAGLTKVYGTTYVSGLASDYWLDTIRLINVENIAFADQTIDIETAGLAGTDSYDFWGSTSGTSIDGTTGNDVIDSGGGSDYIYGDDGDDTLLLFGNRDEFEIVTLSGLTKIYGLDIEGLSGAYWADTIRMYSVESIMFADQTIDIETAGLAGTDSYDFWGSTSGTSIDGTTGNDVIDSGGGSDTIDGGEGDDTLLLFADKSTFDIAFDGETITLTGNSSSGLAGAYYLDTITMTNVETIMFADQTIQVSELENTSSAEDYVCPACGQVHGEDAPLHDFDSETDSSESTDNSRNQNNNNPIILPHNDP